MKILLALILFFSCEASSQISNSNYKKYSIEIFDYDYSLAYTSHYHIFDDSLTIKSIGEIEGEKDSCLLAKKISKTESEKMYKFLCSLDIMKLKSKYENPFIEDGDRKMIRICFENKIKTIEINNIYQKEMANLFNIINQIVYSKFQIKYRSK